MNPPSVRARGFSRGAAVFVLTFAAGMIFGTQTHAETSLTLTGEPGSYVGDGTSYSYDIGNGSFTAQRNFQDGVSVSFSGSSAYWYLDFSGANSAPLAVGLYEGATEFPVYSGGTPGLRVYGVGGSCSGLTGAFRVKQVEYDIGGSGGVTSFWVVFEQRCTGATGSLFGDYRYNADVQIAVTAPFSRTVQRLDTLSFPVSATGTATGPIEIRATDLPSGASFDYDEYRGGTFRWTPTASQYGRHRITFVAEDSLGRIDSTTTVIRVVGETSLTLTSEPGDYVGQGLDYAYGDSGIYNAITNSANGVTFSYRDNSYYNDWTIDFAAPGNAQLTPGSYVDAVAYGYQDFGHPGLRAVVAGRYCSTIRGAFQIKQITYGQSGAIEALWARFEQHCNDVSAALTGEIRYNADVNIAVTAPFSRTVRRLDVLSFPVSATGTATGPIEIRAIDLPSGASFDYDEYRGGTFRWTPTPRQYGRHRITFVAEDNLGRIDSTTTVIRVAGETSLTLTSEPGDYVGQGLNYAYGDSGIYEAVTNSANGVSFSHRDNTYYNDWTIDFAAPGNAQLTPGSYVDAVAYGYQDFGHPGLRAVVAGRYCNTIRGAFQIKQITYGQSGAIEAFWARFEQHCNDVSAALTGEIRFNAAVTVELHAPTSQTVQRGTPLEFGITATDVEPGPIALSATGIPDGASFTYDGNRAGSFAWVPGVEQKGSYLVTFHARNQQGDEDSVQTRIQVTGVTSLTLVSEVGDPLGNGQTYEFTPSNAVFSGVRANGGVLVYAENGVNNRWSIAVTPPVGAALGPGFYPNAQKFATATQAGLNVFRYFNECNSVFGNFQVKQIVVGPDSSLESFWATFEQHCNGNPHPLRGEIRYNADVRVVVIAPVSRSVVRQETLEFTVSATDLDAGPIALSATQLPAGATFTDNGDRTGTFRFTPEIDQVGSHLVVFHGRNTAGREDSTVTQVQVTGLTSLAVESEPGDPIGLGDSFFFPATAGTFDVTRNDYDRGINVAFREGLYGEQWSMAFVPPTGSDLNAAIFENVRRSADATHPGFSVSRGYPYVQCSDFEGQFRILQLVLGTGNQIETFWATFDVHCVEAGGWIHGEIRYNADVRLVLAAPPRIEAERGQPVSIGVNATDLAGRPLALSAFALPQGATFVDEGDDTGILTWTPGWDQFGEFVVGFLADDGAGGLETGRTRIDVRGVSTLAMHSDVGDSVGDGRDYAFNTSNALFWGGRSSRNHVVVTVDGDDEIPWLLGFAPSDTGLIKIGTYLNATAVPAPHRPSLIVTHPNYYGYPDQLYPPCGSITGNFQVKQVAYTSDGRLRSLWVLFEQHCNDVLPALTGELRFNADIVVAITAPGRVEVDPDNELHFDVHAENFTGGSAVLSASGVPSGAKFVDHGNNTGTFTWVPASSQRGLHPITFVARGPFGRADSTVSNVRVRGTTHLSMQSEPGDPVGQGLAYDFTRDQGTFEATRNVANGVSVRFRSTNPAHDFQFDFAAPGNVPLTPRTYSPAARYPFQERPRAGMDVRLDERSCGNLIGNFTVHEITYGTGDEISSFQASFVQRCNGAGPALSGDILFNAGQATFTQASFVSADISSRLARITWRVEDREAQVTIERHAGETPWAIVAHATPDGSGHVVYEDTDVAPGDRIGYRIGIEIGGETQYFGLQWVDIPISLALALGRAWPNPTNDAVSVTLALPDRSPARLELVDIAGRRLASVDAGSLGPGEHHVTIDEVRNLPPGVYTVRLIHKGRSLITPVCVVR